MTTVYCNKNLLPARREEDHYPTDAATINAALTAFIDHLYLQLHDRTDDPWPGYILDPGAGSGVWGDAARDFFPLAAVWGVEIRAVPPHPRYEGWATEDYLGPMVDGGPLFDLVLGNPPYKHAQAFVERSLDRVKNGGHVLFLLRLAFLESVGRRDGLFERYPLRKVWVCSKRPSFQPDGKSGPTAYAVYLWEKGFYGETEMSYLY